MSTAHRVCARLVACSRGASAGQSQQQAQAAAAAGDASISDSEFGSAAAASAAGSASGVFVTGAGRGRGVFTAAEQELLRAEFNTDAFKAYGDGNASLLFLYAQLAKRITESRESDPELQHYPPITAEQVKNRRQFERRQNTVGGEFVQAARGASTHLFCTLTERHKGRLPM